MLGPTHAERASVQFTIGGGAFALRYAIAFSLFIGGAVVALAVPGGGIWGILAIVAGHLPLWVKGKQLAPGGATPVTVTWAPADEDWYDRVQELEKAGQKWDASAWDISNGIGFAVFATIITCATFALLILEVSNPVAWFGALALFVPVWFNGMRRAWNPSELHLIGEALRVANAVAEREAHEFERVALLGLMEGKTGHYPVDARLMLRPKSGGDGDFIGIQVQVSMNNVRGTDYPYLYCVVLAKNASILPDVHSSNGMVRERGTGEGVIYIVVRQHADNSGGWHTDHTHSDRIMLDALEVARRVKQ